MVQLNMPSDGAQFDGKWQDVDEGKMLEDAGLKADTEPAIQTVDVTPEPESEPVKVEPIQEPPRQPRVPTFRQPDDPPTTV